jgi:hypothetical protein
LLQGVVDPALLLAALHLAFILAVNATQYYCEGRGPMILRRLQ